MRRELSPEEAAEELRRRLWLYRVAKSGAHALREAQLSAQLVSPPRPLSGEDLEAAMRRLFEQRTLFEAAA